MYTSLAQSFAIATHTNAFLAGHAVGLDIQTNMWFRYVQYNWFRIGDDPVRVIARSVPQWWQFLKGEGATRARMISGLLDRPTGRQDLHRPWWTASTLLPSGETIWQCTCQPDPDVTDRPQRLYWSSFQIPQDQPIVHGSLEQATELLRDVLARCAAFEREFMPSFQGFALAFESGLRELDRDSAWPEAIDHLFPVGLYPEDCYRLLSAIESSWVFGTIGSWNASEHPDPDIQGLRNGLVSELSGAIAAALYAATNIPL